MTDRNKIQIIAIAVFACIAIGLFFFQEQKKLDGKTEIEAQVRKDFNSQKTELKSWADFFLKQKDLPSEWILENRARGGLWFHDQSPHDGLINLFDPKFELPENLEKHLKLFNISEIFFFNDSVSTYVEYIFENYYITSSQDRRLRLIYYPPGNNNYLMDERQKTDELNWQTVLEPNWVLESSSDK